MGTLSQTIMEALSIGLLKWNQVFQRIQSGAPMLVGSIPKMDVGLPFGFDHCKGLAPEVESIFSRRSDSHVRCFYALGRLFCPLNMSKKVVAFLRTSYGALRHQIWLALSHVCLLGVPLCPLQPRTSKTKPVTVEKIACHEGCRSVK